MASEVDLVSKRVQVTLGPHVDLPFDTRRDASAREWTIRTATSGRRWMTPDGRYLFFSRSYGAGTWQTTTDADLFWVDMAVVERLKR